MPAHRTACTPCRKHKKRCLPSGPGTHSCASCLMNDRECDLNPIADVEVTSDERHASLRAFSISRPTTPQPRRRRSSSTLSTSHVLAGRSRKMPRRILFASEQDTGRRGTTPPTTEMQEQIQVAVAMARITHGQEMVTQGLRELQEALPFAASSLQPWRDSLDRAPGLLHSRSLPSLLSPADLVDRGRSRSRRGRAPRRAVPDRFRPTSGPRSVTQEFVHDLDTGRSLGDAQRSFPDQPNHRAAPQAQNQSGAGLLVGPSEQGVRTGPDAELQLPTLSCAPFGDTLTAGAASSLQEPSISSEDWETIFQQCFPATPSPQPHSADSMAPASLASRPPTL